MKNRDYILYVDDNKNFYNYILKDIVSDRDSVYCLDAKDACSTITSRGMPETIILDCHRGKLDDAGMSDLFALLKSFPKERPPSHILFLSAEKKLALKAKGKAMLLHADLPIKFWAAAKEEALFARNIAKNISCRLDYKSGFGFFRFLNEVLGKEFPTDIASLIEYMMTKRLMPDEEVIKLFHERLISGERQLYDALNYLQRSHLPLADGQFKTPFAEYAVSTVKLEENYPIANFSYGYGMPVNLYAAFSLRQAMALIEDGKRPALITDKYSTDLYGSGDKYDALALLSGKRGFEHLIFDAKSKKIPVLVGARDYKWILDEKGERAALECGGSRIEFGSPITINITKNECGIHKGHLKISHECEIPLFVSAIPKMYSELLGINGKKPLEFTAKIGGPDQIETSLREFGADIGLLKTEPMAYSSPTQIKALKSALSANGNRLSCPIEFGDGQLSQMREVFANLYDYILGSRKKASINIRLIDIRLPELFNEKEMEMLGDDKAWNDFQLSGRNSATTGKICEQQIEAIIQAYEQEIYGKECAELASVNIIIPMLRKQHTIGVVKHMISKAENKHGISNGKIGLGVMCETLDAAENIADIAKKVSVILFGDNDLNNIFYERRPLDGTLHMHVHQIIVQASAAAREANPDIKLGLVGDGPTNIRTLIKTGSLMDFVAVPPDKKHMWGLRADYCLYDHLLMRHCGMEKNIQTKPPSTLLHLKSVAGLTQG